VIAPDAVPTLAVPGAKASYRIPIDRENAGCQNLIQRIFRYEAGTSPEMKNNFSEEVLYVVSGAGQATIDGHTVALIPSTSVLIPPRVTYVIHNPGPEPLEFVSVLSPQPDRPGSVPTSPETQPVGQLALHESQEAPIPAGPDRYFKLMIDPRYGAQYVTQFIGFIEKSRAPLHVHTYEEVIYILGGQGQVHIDDGVFPMSAGTSIYLPPGTPHCLENTSPETLSLLGVFCPAGSPANRTNVGDDKGENVVD
jgi:mannose-6-phosphate isomerase-like protein (cupin superfamily)